MKTHLLISVQKTLIGITSFLVFFWFLFFCGIKITTDVPEVLLSDKFNKASGFFVCNRIRIYRYLRTEDNISDRCDLGAARLFSDVFLLNFQPLYHSSLFKFLFFSLHYLEYNMAYFPNIYNYFGV